MKPHVKVQFGFLERPWQLPEVELMLSKMPTLPRPGDSISMPSFTSMLDIMADPPETVRAHILPLLIVERVWWQPAEGTVTLHCELSSDAHSDSSAITKVDATNNPTEEQWDNQQGT
jgi:hypothetical protein